YYHIFASKSHDVGIDLAEKLVKMAPVPMSKVFFANSGSEANDTVVKLVWYYNNALGRPAKKKILARIKEAGETEEQFASRLADNLEKLILTEGPDTVAAMIAEPVMGAGGVLVPPKTYFEKIQKVLRKYDILLIADEVICGFGRTGNMFGTETFGLQPDMIVVAKALSSAYLPISGVSMSDKIYQALLIESEKIGTFGHGYTYSAHPVPAAVALETLKIYEE